MNSTKTIMYSISVKGLDDNMLMLKSREELRIELNELLETRHNWFFHICKPDLIKLIKGIYILRNK